MTRAVAEIDHDAIAHNLAVVRQAAPGIEIMAVVKADAYGHGAIPVAATAREAGVTWLGVALPSEALALRHGGDRGRILAWLWAPGDPDLAGCIASDVDLSVSSLWALDEIAEIAHVQGKRVRVHVKVDTGLTRNGLPVTDLPALIAQLQDVHRDVEAVGLWSHLAEGETPGHASVAEQRTRFEECLAMWTAAGLPTDVVHLANSGATFAHPDCHYTLVRPMEVRGRRPRQPTSGLSQWVMRMEFRVRPAIAQECRSTGVGARWSAAWPWTSVLWTSVPPVMLDLVTKL